MRRAIWFVGPALAYLAIFAFVPLLLAAWMSLHDWRLLKPERTFVGLTNYARIAADPFFRNALLNTLVYVVVSVPLGIATALAVALLVAQRLPGMGFFRTLFYIPAVSSQVAIAMVWIWILLPEVGLLNAVLGALGLPNQTNFLAQPATAMLSIVALSVWIGLGPRMIVFVAGLQGIPTEVYEAAAIDGCVGAGRFWRITLPLLRPTMVFVLVTTTIAAFQLFTPVYVMTRGGPRRSTDVLLYHIYQEAWLKFDAGTASAMTFVLLALIVAVALVQFRVLRRGMIEGYA